MVEKWEYHIINLSRIKKPKSKSAKESIEDWQESFLQNEIEAINDAGNKGWELVDVTQPNDFDDSKYAYFKRRKPSQS